MGMLDNILNIFKTPNIKEAKTYDNIKSPGIKLPELVNIGIDVPKCPYCNVELQKFPARKTKCKNCGEYIYVRTRPIDYKKVLLKETELQLLEEEWGKRKYINEKQKDPQNSILHIVDNITIDSSSEMNRIMQHLIKRYKDYCNYDEILHIDEKDRLPILKYIWNKWMVHGSSIEKDLKYTYQQYDFKDIRLIANKEHNRMNAIYKQQKAIEMFEDGSKDCLLLQPFATFSCCEEENQWRMELGDNPSYENLHKNFSRHLCLIYDMHKISDTWYRTNGVIDHYFFGVFTDKIKPQDLKHYKFWVNGELKQLNETEFLKWCKRYGIDYPIYEKRER